MSGAGGSDRSALAADLARLDAGLLLQHQHASGAFVASPSFSQYPFAWLRDGSFVAHALDRAGHVAAADRFHGWVAGVIERHAERMGALVERGRRGEHPEERAFLPARFGLDGAWHDDDWPAFQLDGYGQWLWSLGRHVEVGGEPSAAVLRAARAVADYLDVFALEPCYDAWEEGRTQLHTSTLASTEAGLRVAATLLGSPYAATADRVHGFLERECTVAEDGRRRFVKAVRNETVDASLLWISTPFALWPPGDDLVRNTVARIERDLLVDGGLQRYRADTFYGGGAWVLLTAWLGWHHARAGDPGRARALLAWVDAQRDGAGALPEQVPVSRTHPGFLRFWTQRWGDAARPLLWSHAMALLARLELDA